MRRLLALALVLVAAPALAQPATPCAPNNGSWTVTTTSATLWVCASDGQSWVQVGAGGSSGLAAGDILLRLSGTCPAGFEEATELAGKALVGTLAANKDVGTTGGSDTITPAGSVAAPTFTGTAWSAPAIAWPAGVPTISGTAASFTGNASTTVVNHVHTLATGTGTTGNFAQVIGTVDTSSGGNGGTPTQTALGTLSGNPTAGGAASYTPTGTVAITSQGTAAWPAGVPTIGAYTPQGSVTAPAFTGTQFDNRSAFVRVIFCRKT